MEKVNLRIGIDLGGTKIEGIALDLNKAGQEVFRKRIPTPDNYSQCLASLCGLIDEIRKSFPERPFSVGIGIPGAEDRQTGLIKNANSTFLIGKPFRQDIAKILDHKVQLANDANCFVMSEAQDGAGADFESVFGVILGTGCGGGLVFRNQLIVGPNSIAGEWGHNPLPWPDPEELPGRPCYCGKSGCIETYLSGPGLAADYSKGSELSLKAKEIATRADEGQIQAMECMDRYELRLAKSLAHVINIYDPGVIILGGGVSNISRLYINVPKLWKKFVFTGKVVTKLCEAKFGDSSGVRGAAWLEST